MGKALFQNYEVVRNTFEEALGMNLTKIYFEDYKNELVKTENTQPAILTLSTAMFRVFMERFGIEPKFMAGHSIGEFTALTCSGSISFSDAVKIVRKRGKLMRRVYTWCYFWI
jgi:[acyl-carrier-protein] S-malonyltransferase